MAYLNNKPSCFSPKIMLEQSAAKLQEKAVDDLSNGDVILRPDAGFDGMSKVSIAGLYYNDYGEIYSKAIRIKKDYDRHLDNCAGLEKVIFDKGANDEQYVIPSLNNCKDLKTIVFDNDCNAIDMGLNGWLANSPVETLIFKNVADSFGFDMWMGNTDNLTFLSHLEVCEGWDRDLVFNNSPRLTAGCMMAVINNLATVTESRSLWIGDDNIVKLSQEYIDIAVNKGWDVF